MRYWKAELAASDLILMTSEMLNSRVRNYKSEQNEWLKEIGTLVVDESHLLTVPGRGDKLEVGLMKFSQDQLGVATRQAKSSSWLLHDSLPTNE